jgi:hypothetical protein
MKKVLLATNSFEDRMDWEMYLCLECTLATDTNEIFSHINNDKIDAVIISREFKNRSANIDRLDIILQILLITMSTERPLIFVETNAFNVVEFTWKQMEKGLRRMDVVRKIENKS